MPETESSRMLGFTDDTKYQNMIKNRPKLSAIPLANPRILMQRSGTGLFITVISSTIMLAFLANHGRDLLSKKLYPTRKRFTFKSDPYSGTVNCQYQDAPYKQCGY